MGRTGVVLAQLEQVIAARRGASADRSYTSRLLHGGVPAAGAKVVEEAGEFVAAAESEADERVVSEAADLFYHALVLLAVRDLPLARVEEELARRFGVSGLEEKASRSLRVESPDRADRPADPREETPSA
jgi:phosphoribosyl-ATP pyrophosphohydrolase